MLEVLVIQSLLYIVGRSHKRNQILYILGVTVIQPYLEPNPLDIPGSSYTESTEYSGS